MKQKGTGSQGPAGSRSVEQGTKRKQEMKDKYIAKKYWKDVSTPLKNVFEKAAAYEDIINLGVGDPDLTTDPRVTEAAFRDAKAGHTHYTPQRGDVELRRELVYFYREEYGYDLPIDNVMITASGNIGMFYAMQAILDPGDEVIIQSPYYLPYPNQVRLAGGIPLEFDTLEEEDYQFNVERLENMINERTKAIVINSPNNPTGSTLSLETMQKLAQVAEKYDLLVVCDDIYTSFSYQEKFVPFMTLPGMDKRSIAINSFSKDFLMTGWRVGDIVAPKHIIDTIATINEAVTFTPPSVSQRAAIAALRMRHEIQPPVVEEYKKRMYYASQRVNKLRNMHVPYPPKGTFYLFINIKDTGLTSEEVCRRMLEEAHVLMIPGSGFGRCGEGYVRMCCTLPSEELGRAFDRLGKMSLFKVK